MDPDPHWHAVPVEEDDATEVRFTVQHTLNVLVLSTRMPSTHYASVHTAPLTTSFFSSAKQAEMLHRSVRVGCLSSPRGPRHEPIWSWTSVRHELSRAWGLSSEDWNLTLLFEIDGATQLVSNEFDWMVVAPRAISDGIQATVCATRIPLPSQPPSSQLQVEAPQRIAHPDRMNVVVTIAHDQYEPAHPYHPQPAGANQGVHLDYSELLSRTQNINQHLETMADSSHAHQPTDMNQVYAQLRKIEKQSRALSVLQAQLHPPASSVPPAPSGRVENCKPFLASQPILTRAPPAPARMSLSPRKISDSSSQEVKAEPLPDPNTSNDPDTAEAFMANEPTSACIKSATKNGKRPEGSTSSSRESKCQPPSDAKPSVQAEAEPHKTEAKTVPKNEGQNFEQADQPTTNEPPAKASRSLNEPSQGDSKVKSSSDKGKEPSNGHGKETKVTQEAKASNQVESKPEVSNNGKGSVNQSDNKVDGLKPSPPTVRFQSAPPKSTESVSAHKSDATPAGATYRVSAPPLRPPPAPMPITQPGPSSQFGKPKLPKSRDSSG